jgi:hypothetical protein
MFLEAFFVCRLSTEARRPFSEWLFTYRATLSDLVG